ncbi:MAG TPA: phage holin family protein [Spirochaetota bacterium]|nr:phage holin family protein [Spirochaetota bacterium]
MEIMEVVKSFIKPELLILIPVLYLIGVGIKKSNIKDMYIPLLLGFVSLVLCGLYVGSTSDIHGFKDICTYTFTVITQAILIAGASVYANQIYKQLSKGE